MIGKRLRDIRRLNNVKQEELAAIIGVKGPAISRYESDKDDPSDAIKVKIARYFNVSLDYLLGVIDEPVPPFSEKAFIQLPASVTKDELFMISELLSYIEYRRKK